MIAAFNRLLRRDTATVPSMDGALRPNQELDRAEVVASCDAPDNLIEVGNRFLFSCGNELLSWHGRGKGTIVARRFDGEIIALAASPDGGIAVALKERGITIVGGGHDGVQLSGIGPKQLTAITAMAFVDADTLIVCIGSERLGVNDWQRDLLEGGESGSVWKIFVKSQALVRVAQKLAYPAGVLLRGDRLVVSEAWRHRLIELPLAGEGRMSLILDDLPGYPGRLSARPDAGAWLSVFAPRSQLVEFVLREQAFRRHMMDRIEKCYWIAPSLRAGRSFKEPMQVGAVKTLGMHKPWAPTRSYGLAVRLDDDFMPVQSLHSRADGIRHGVTSCVEIDGRLIATCRGDGVVVAADLTADRRV